MGTRQKKRHKPASLSLCSEWYPGPPSFAQVLHPWQNDTIHRLCPRLLLSSEHCRPHCIHKNGMVFICIHVLPCSGTWTLLLCYSLRLIEPQEFSENQALQKKESEQRLGVLHSSRLAASFIFLGCTAYD